MNVMSVLLILNWVMSGGSSFGDEGLVNRSEVGITIQY